MACAATAHGVCGYCAWRVRLLRMVLLAMAMAMFWRIAGFAAQRRMAFFMILATQAFWACCGHVANDALAIPVLVWLYFEAERRSRLACGLLMVGLLVKANFLAVVPVVVWRLRHQWRWLIACNLLPALWYARNLTLYGNLSGMQEQLTPLPLSALWRAARELPWLASLGETYRGALWLANNSFNQWSVVQVHVVMLALLGATIFALRQNAERRNWLLVFGGSYAMALAFAAVQSFAYTRGAAVAASPWYATPLWLLLIMIIFAGPTPQWILRAFVILWAYWFIASFWLRLIPLYAGLMDGPATLRNINRWYGSGFDQMRNEIGLPALLMAVMASLMAIAVAICEVNNGGSGSRGARALNE
jgi:hypothetical protein